MAARSCAPNVEIAGALSASMMRRRLLLHGARRHLAFGRPPPPPPPPPEPLPELVLGTVIAANLAVFGVWHDRRWQPWMERHLHLVVVLSISIYALLWLYVECQCRGFAWQRQRGGALPSGTRLRRSSSSISDAARPVALVTASAAHVAGGT